MARSRRELPTQGGFPVVLVVLALVAVGGGAFFFGQQRALAPAEPEAPARQSPAGDTKAMRKPEPVTTPLTKLLPQATEADIEVFAGRLARDRMRETTGPGAFESGQEELAKGIFDAMKAQAIAEIKLGRRAMAWGKSRGKSEESQGRVFVRIVDAAHRADAALEELVSDSILTELYGQEERFERATK